MLDIVRTPDIVLMFYHSKRNYLDTNVWEPVSWAWTRPPREKVQASEPVETEEQLARLGLLTELLERRGADYYRGEEEDRELSTLIDFLCTD